MLILTEGCDGVGKSTFISELADLLKPHESQVIHRGQPQLHPLEEYEDDLLGYTPNSSVSVLGDRWHWGELVYGPLYRGKSLLGVAGRRHVDLFLMTRGAIMVHLTASEDTVRQRLAVRGEDYLRDEHIGTVLRGFAECAFGSMIPAITITSPHSRADTKKVIAQARAREAKVGRVHEFPYIGHPRPDVLVVGNPTDEVNGIPFQPFPDTPYAVMFNTMRPLVRYGFTTAEDVHEMWDALDFCPNIVALGYEASRRLGGIPHGVTYHPRRFASERMMTEDQYARTILGAAVTQKDATL